MAHRQLVAEEMQAIEASIASPGLAGIVVCGAAGVGKSRIAREALTNAESKGCAIRWTVASSSARALPLGAFASWADSSLTDKLQVIRGVIDSLALTCSARAAELATRCGGAITPALRKADEPVLLTDREREIVLMLAQGLSNRAIADRLTLSVRTVEGHIYRAMAKTGAADCGKLTRMLPRRATAT